jgi:hypothetical protein
MGITEDGPLARLGIYTKERNRFGERITSVAHEYVPGLLHLDGIKRLQEALVPRSRPAPDGRKSGGTQRTDISRINHRF